MGEFRSLRNDYLLWNKNLRNISKPEDNGELLCVIDDRSVLDAVRIDEVGGVGLQRREDHGVAEDAGLHVVIPEPVHHEPVLAVHHGGAHGAGELLLVLTLLVSPPCLN